MILKTVGSVCSGIEAASVAWEPIGMHFEWFSEIADFPSQVIASRYPKTTNLGDMNIIPAKIESRDIAAPDLICGGTPCQAFSLAGWKNGLNDDRGNLTLKFVDIVEANDKIRLSEGKEQSIVFWENVEGVLTDKTNAFGCLVCSLAGFNSDIKLKRWPNSGIIHGTKRNVAWRVLDAKYFGLPQQRRRLYLIAGGKNFFPENVLFEHHKENLKEYPQAPLKFKKEGHNFELFREYTDCLYCSYGTKWNGNAAAYNGSLFVVQDGRIRRLSPLECERLMGFPDGYTDLPGAKKTNRYQATGNSWAVPVVKWIGERLISYEDDKLKINENNVFMTMRTTKIEDKGIFVNLGKDIVEIDSNISINCTAIPENCRFKDIQEVISPDAPEDIYISPVGCYGIVRRKQERNLKINERLENILTSIASQMAPEDIEKRSRIQKRGKFSSSLTVKTQDKKSPKLRTHDLSLDSKYKQLSLFDN